MSTIHQLLPTIATAAITAAVTVGLMTYTHKASTTDRDTPFQQVATDINYPLNFPAPIPAPTLSKHIVGLDAPSNFISAAQSATPTVVNIRTISPKNKWSGFSGIYDSKAEDWTNPKSDSGASGSGVIVSPDGYIVTNKHVVAGSTSIEVTLYNRQSFPAELIAEDPNTDIALLKINAYGLSAIPYGDSDNLQVGEWVLAVGNPFNLASTVTAGIVSAKGRNINILQSREAIESFIQTDAAVNPGNSGGALVNTRGELVGVNTAIASGTGSFSGYSFAVPVNLVKKVVEDLKRYGIVQSASLGIKFESITNSLANTYGLSSTKGVLVVSVVDGSGAKDAGLAVGDVITEVNGIAVNTSSELQEKIARFRPGDNIAISYTRRQQGKFANVTLKNSLKNTGIVRTPKEEVTRILGAELQELSILDLQSYGLRNGIKVVKLNSNGLLSLQTPIKVGCVLDFVNKKPVFTHEDVYNALKDVPAGESVRLEGVYEKGSRVVYTFTMK